MFVQDKIHSEKGLHFFLSLGLTVSNAVTVTWYFILTRNYIHLGLSKRGRKGGSESQNPNLKQTKSPDKFTKSMQQITKSKNPQIPTFKRQNHRSFKKIRLKEKSSCTTDVVCEDNFIAGGAQTANETRESAG